MSPTTRELLLLELRLALDEIPKEDSDLYNEAMTDLSNLLTTYPDVLTAFTKVLMHRLTNG